MGLPFGYHLFYGGRPYDNCLIIFCLRVYELCTGYLYVFFSYEITCNHYICISYLVYSFIYLFFLHAPSPEQITYPNAKCRTGKGTAACCASPGIYIYIHTKQYIT